MALIDTDDKKNILARAAEIVDEQYKKGERLAGPQAAVYGPDLHDMRLYDRRKGGILKFRDVWHNANEPQG